MANTRKEGENGHHNERTGAERVRSGFDRRKNWGDSIENVYRRIDHRLTELVQESSDKSKALKSEVEGYADRFPLQMLAACFATGLFVGVLMGRKGK